MDNNEIINIDEEKENTKVISEATKAIVNAIIAGESSKLSELVDAAMQERIAVAIDDKRQEMSQNMFSDKELTLEDYSLEELEEFMVSEDYVALDELSKDTLLRYRDKAVRSSKLAQGKLRGLDKKVDDAEAHHAEMEDTPVRSSRTVGIGTLHSGGHVDYESKERAIDYAKNNVDKAISDRNSKTPKLQHKRNVRNVGILRATKKLTNELEDYSLEELEEFMVSEDYEALDELSKKTLGSYVKRAGDHRIQLSKNISDISNASRDLSHIDTLGNKKMSDALGDTRRELDKKADRLGDKDFNRKFGIHRALKKLTKESAE